MAVKDTPVFSQKPMSASAVCTAAKTTYTGSANAVPLLSAGADGAILIRLTAIPRATVTATQLQLYSSPDNGTTLNLIATKLMPAYTMAQTTEAPIADFGFSLDDFLLLGPTEQLYVAAGVALAGGIVFRAEYGDLS